jgi:hypothetical protein
MKPNGCMQAQPAFCDRVTADTGPTRWLIGEFGAALVISVDVTAWLWQVRDAALCPAASLQLATGGKSR